MYPVATLAIDSNGFAINPRTRQLEQVYARYAADETGQASQTEIGHYFASDPDFPGVDSLRGTVQPLGPLTFHDAEPNGLFEYAVMGGLGALGLVAGAGVAGVLSAGGGAAAAAAPEVAAAVMPAAIPEAAAPLFSLPSFSLPSFPSLSSALAALGLAAPGAEEPVIDVPEPVYPESPMSISSQLRSLVANQLNSVLTGGMDSAPGSGMLIPDYGPIGGGYGGMDVTQAAFPAILGQLGSKIGGLFGRGGSQVATLGAGGIGGAVVRGTVGLVRSAAGKIRGVVLASGRYVSSKKGKELAKRIGIDAAAAALGIGAVDMAEMILSDSDSSSKRRRGITAAQMRTTRRTIGKVERLHRQIVHACSSAHVVRHRRPSMPARRCR